MRVRRQLNALRDRERREAYRAGCRRLATLWEEFIARKSKNDIAHSVWLWGHILKSAKAAEAGADRLRMRLLLRPVLWEWHAAAATLAAERRLEEEATARQEAMRVDLEAATAEAAALATREAAEATEAVAEAERARLRDFQYKRDMELKTKAAERAADDRVVLELQAERHAAWQAEEAGRRATVFAQSCVEMRAGMVEDARGEATAFLASVDGKAYVEDKARKKPSHASRARAPARPYQQVRGRRA